MLDSVLDRVLILVEQTTRQVLDIMDRCQLNLILDGRCDLLETIKEVAAAEGLSVNAWVVKTLEQAASNPTPKSGGTHPTPPVADIEPMLDTMLDAVLDTMLDIILDSALDIKKE